MAKCNNRSSHVNVASTYLSSEKACTGQVLEHPMYWLSEWVLEHILVKWESMYWSNIGASQVLVKSSITACTGQVSENAMYWSNEKAFTGNMLEHAIYCSSEKACTGQVSEHVLVKWVRGSCFVGIHLKYGAAAATTGHRQTKEIRRRHLHKYVFGSLTNTHARILWRTTYSGILPKIRCMLCDTMFM